ncbi:MAG: septum formation inhibitor Maf [Betaproteobacteria bacterium]|nr:MAG: septum formation inhibitor Maf [Betaproteobacteria bacterium]TAG48725.1 MAG: septum formation inhibitor Maf [Betaproteobacteria bacterium]
MNEIYLASKSPRRLELLQQMGVACKMLMLREDGARMRDVDESPLPSENPFIYVERMAKMKTQIGLLRVKQRAMTPMPLLGADTTVVHNGTILGKPTSAADAARMLRKLSGTTHEVLTSVAVTNGSQMLHDTCVTRVRFRDLNDDEIKKYIASGEPMGKAGSYAIQGLGAIFVERIEGSYSGVMGLPIYETAILLSRFGIKTV